MLPDRSIPFYNLEHIYDVLWPSAERVQRKREALSTNLEHIYDVLWPSAERVQRKRQAPSVFSAYRA